MFIDEEKLCLIETILYDWFESALEEIKEDDNIDKGSFWNFYFSIQNTKMWRLLKMKSYIHQTDHEQEIKELYEEFI